MSDPDIISAYDAIAPLYAEYSSQRQAYLDAIDELVISHLEGAPRLLDIGSGDGRRLAKIRQRAALDNVVAVEPSAAMARLCEQNAGVRVFQTFGENIDQLDLGEFDVATALWNIFGHIPGTAARLKTLVNIRAKLTAEGRLMLDVNNRHNALAYGRWNVLLRRVIDRFNFRESRGDAHYDWKIGDETFSASGHLFTPVEIEKLFAEAGFSVSNRYSVNYANGEISDSSYRGQLFYILKNGN